MNILKLPQCEIIYTPEISSREVLYIAGGRRPDINWFKKVAQDKNIICVDKGIEVCHDCNILPELLIGDFDSANKLALDWAINNSVAIERHPVDKDFTDMQLALTNADKSITAIVTGAFGGRADHLFSTIFSSANAPIKTVLADDSEIIFYVNGGESVAVAFNDKPVAVSLLPISKTCEGVTINGVHWKLSNATLAQDLPYAISNRVESAEIKISVDNGTLAIYMCFNEDFNVAISD